MLNLHEEQNPAVGRILLHQFMQAKFENFAVTLGPILMSLLDPQMILTQHLRVWDAGLARITYYLHHLALFYKFVDFDFRKDFQKPIRYHLNLRSSIGFPVHIYPLNRDIHSLNHN